MKNNKKYGQLKDLPLSDKYLLSVSEAAAFFNICEKKIRRLVSQYPNANLAVANGRNILIRRKKFEEFIDTVLEV